MKCCKMSLHSLKVCGAFGAMILAALVASPNAQNVSGERVSDRLLNAYQARLAHAHGPTAPVQTELAFTQEPAIGSPVGLLLNVLPLQDGPNGEVRFDVPKGISVRAGTPLRKGDHLRANQLYQYPLTVSIDQPGDYVLSGSAIMGPEGAQFGRRVSLYIHATFRGVTVTTEQPLSPEQKRTVGSVRQVSAAEPITLDPGAKDRLVPKTRLPEGVTEDPNQGDTATTRVYGYFYYRHADTTWHPAYGTAVYAWDADSWSGDDFLGSVACGGDGYWSITFDNDSDGGLESGTADVYIKFESDNAEVEVHDSSSNVYVASTGTTDNISSGDHNYGGLGIDWGTSGVSDSGERAFQIHEYMSDSWAYGAGSLSWDTHFTSCRWFMGSTDGTYYSTGEDRIHLAQDDHNSPAVVQHEYGHSSMDSIYGENYIPGSGGSHWFTNHYNTALAMSEGYATYYSCVSRNDHWYDDNNPGNLIHWDCEPNHDGYGAANGNVDGLGYGYDTESAVLAFLLDLEDTNNSPTDPYDWTSGHRNIIFDVMRNYLPGGHHPYSIQEFYDGWKSRGWSFVPKLNGQMQVHGMEQGINNPTLGLYSGLSRFTGTWYWNGYGRGSYDVKNYGSRPYAHTGFYVWLRYPDGGDAFGLGFIAGTSPIASGATFNVWSTQDHIANDHRVIGTYSLTAGHWKSDGGWAVLQPGESGTTNTITVPVVADTTAPTSVSVVDDGVAQNNSTQLHIVGHAYENESAIAGYWTRVGTAAGAGDEQDWVYHAAYNQTTFDYTITGLTMAANVKYYVTLVARNVEGLDTFAYTDGIYAWDATPPGAVTVTDDGVYTYDLTQLHFVATTSEPDGEIMGYWVQIGTTSGGNDVKTWEFFASNATTFEHTVTGLTLVDGKTYYITVVARNKSVLDTWGFSNGITAKIDKTVKGRIALRDWIPGAYWTLIKIHNPGATGYVEYHWVYPDSAGNYSFGTGLTGTYDVTAQSYHWLRQRRTRVAFTGTTITGVNFTLTNGDVDGDNAVTVFDYNRLSDAFDTVAGDAKWDWYADLDGDGAVTVFDYNILSASFDMVGDD